MCHSMTSCWAITSSPLSRTGLPSPAFAEAILPVNQHPYIHQDPSSLSQTESHVQHHGLALSTSLSRLTPGKAFALPADY